MIIQRSKLQLTSRHNLWLGALVVTLNLLAWVSILLTAPEPYVVEPIRDREVVELLDHIRSGDHSGEEWQVSLTELEAEQTITWYLHRYPQIPFAHPRVEITPDYVAGEGDATIAGLRVHVGGKARITLSEGLPEVEIIALSLPVPGPIRQAIEDEIQIQLRRADALPVRFSSAEWRDGEVVVRGIVR
ncbi:MAG: hypothetical protein H6631_02670 [Anaerolineaceae bacterium]|nr:hypothetical protein [Anaerolineaceae bacterium]